jgi:hypothetical protein
MRAADTTFRPGRDRATCDDTSAVVHRRMRYSASSTIMQVACYIAVMLRRLSWPSWHHPSREITMPAVLCRCCGLSRCCTGPVGMRT